jgi:hypothetical protein
MPSKNSRIVIVPDDLWKFIETEAKRRRASRSQVMRDMIIENANKVNYKLEG